MSDPAAADPARPETPEGAGPAAAPRRWPRRLLLLLLLLPALAALLVERRFRAWPATEGTLRVAGLDAPVEVLRDAYGIPHVLARSPRDAYFGLGFCEAQDRTLQLEVLRRAASGTLSEVLGEGPLPIDRLVRTLDLPGLARRQLALSEPKARALAEAFCAGINAGLESLAALPPEMALLGLEPGRWTPADCLALSRFVAFGLAEDPQSEALFARIRDRLGEARARLLVPVQPPLGPPERVQAGPPAGAPRVARLDPALEQGIRELKERFGLRLACSNWIVGPGRSRSGRPIFAYDSHQGGARVPGEVYLAHLKGGEELDVIGGVIVGLPGIYVGATPHIAFGPTNLGGDAIDLVRVVPDPARPAGAGYLVQGRPRDFVVRREEIAIKGRAPLVLEVQETLWGPIVSDIFPAGGGALALRWVGARADLSVDGYIGLPLARDWPSFRAGLARFNAAAQHYGFAAAEGTIAYQVIGPMPRRLGAPAPWPVEAEDAGPQALLSLDELPHRVDPKDGFIVTANHRPQGADAPHYLGRTFVHAARHDRLAELLEGLGPAQLDVEALRQVGLDTVSAFARRTAPALADVLRGAASADARWYGERLAAWDHAMRVEALEPLLHHALWTALARALLEDELGRELLEAFASRPEHSQERLARLLEDPSSPFWDDVSTAGRTETRAEVVERAALAALADLERRLGRDRSRWRWGHLHRLTYRHYASEATSLFDLGPFPVPGDDDTPFRFGNRPARVPFQVETVTLVRLIADLGRPEAVHAVLSTGQSGWPFHPHYQDQVPLWLRGELIRIPRGTDEVRATCPARLVLEPR